MATDYYKNFNDNVRDLVNKQKELASAPDIHTLNKLEREAQQLLFSLQHTSMGLAYWIQDTSRARRKDIMLGDVSAPAPIAPESTKKARKAKAKKEKK